MLERGTCPLLLNLLSVLFPNKLIIVNAYHVPGIDLGDLYTLF